MTPDTLRRLLADAGLSVRQWSRITRLTRGALYHRLSGVNAITPESVALLVCLARLRDFCVNPAEIERDLAKLWPPE